VIITSVYNAKNNEQQQLKKLTYIWDFWNYQEVCKTLSLANVKLIYIQNNSIPNKWLGALLFYNGLDFSEVYYIFVHTKARKQGIAKKLLEHLEKIILSKKEQVELFLEVKESNYQARSLYSKFGMKIISKRNNYYHGKEVALIFKKNLKQKK
jgi:ribosomal protein S18 acetylase RimI-like enzyme